MTCPVLLKQRVFVYKLINSNDYCHMLDVKLCYLFNGSHHIRHDTKIPRAQYQATIMPNEQYKINTIITSALCECGLFVFLLLLTFPICIFPSSFFYVSHLLFYFFFYLLPSRILDPLRFQAGGRRRRPNLGLVCI